jgi:hypothetical protein
MKSRGYRAAALLLFIATVPRLHAQGVVDNGSAKPIGYDVAEEITVSGAATRFLTKAQKGMVNGSHLFLSNASGSLDVSVGTYGSGKESVEISTGANVEVTGVMKTLNDKPVLLARRIKVGERSYVIRTRQGIVVSPLARKHIARQSGLEGGTL